MLFRSPSALVSDPLLRTVHNTKSSVDRYGNLKSLRASLRKVGSTGENACDVVIPSIVLRQTQKPAVLSSTDEARSRG